MPPEGHLSAVSRRRYTRRGFIAGAASAAAAGGFWLAGCSAGNNEGSRPPRLRDRPKPEGKRPAPGRLRVGVVRPPATDGIAFSTLEALLVHARLVAVDYRQAAVYADLARSVEHPEPTVVRFTLRDNARFHAPQGEPPRPVTAEAVRLDFERRAADGVPLFAQVIERIETPDPRTVLLRLRAPFGLLFELLAQPSASIRGDALYPGTQERVGAGMFVPGAREGDLLHLVPNPALKGDSAPRLGAIDVLAATQERELDVAFAQGRIDVRDHLDDFGLQAGAGRADRAVLRRPARRIRGLGMSLVPQKGGREVRAIPAFQDARVRRALSLAMDRAALRADTGWLSGPVPPAHTADALPPSELEAHPLYQHQPDQARALLDAAGQTGLAFTILYPDLASMASLTRPLQEALTVVGFRPRLQPLPLADWQQAFMAGDFEATLAELNNLDTPDIGLRLHTGRGLDNKFSPWGYANPVYDAAVNVALAQFDPAHRAEKSREAQRVLLEDVPAFLPIMSPADFASVAPGVTGYEFEAFEFNAGYLAHQWAAPA